MNPRLNVGHLPSLCLHMHLFAWVMLLPRPLGQAALGGQGLYFASCLLPWVPEPAMAHTALPLLPGRVMKLLSGALGSAVMSPQI